LAKQLLEANLGWERCEIHQKRREVICLTDRSVICSSCALWNGHRDHNIKHIAEIKSEFETQQKQLATELQGLDQYHKDLDNILDEQKSAMRDIVEERFKEITLLLNLKKQGLLYELDTLFEQQRTKLNTMIGDESILSSILSEKIENYKNSPSNEKIFDLLENDISDYRDKLNQFLAKSDIDKFQDNIHKLVGDFNSSLFTQVDSLIQEEIVDQTQDRLLRDQRQGSFLSTTTTTANSTFSDFKLKSSFEFETCNGYFELTSSGNSVRTIIMDNEEWKKMKEVRIKLDRFVLIEEDKVALDYIWNKMELVRCVKIEASFQKTISEEQLVTLLSIIFSKPQNLREIEINFLESNIGDETMVYLFEKILHNVSALKVLSLNVYGTTITDESIRAFAREAIPNMKALEFFSFYSGNTNICQDSVAELFISLPNLSKFELGCSSTNFGDQALNLFVKNSLVSMTNLKKLKLRLWKTQVTDDGAANLFSNLPDLKAFTFDLGSNSITDESVKILTENKLLNMPSLKNFKLYLYDTKVSEQTMSKVYEIKNKLSK